eukprot:CAMPEP_0176121884 /NCGR_PEP_ID=MMETSP0120_2-20121206/61366_1 /TAXON_ID=160619 /ORGANISM="Kryptoperidinium foliaceum, Strain CCMP 1326" /LENGTH=154 /DNA_ID=CAMNT_0017456465 /DNA_START=143 /DNA_END=603 /DNA_ORIENTATION=+
MTRSHSTEILCSALAKTASASAVPSSCNVRTATVSPAKYERRGCVRIGGKAPCSWTNNSRPHSSRQRSHPAGGGHIAASPANQSTSGGSSVGRSASMRTSPESPASRPSLLAVDEAAAFKSKCATSRALADSYFACGGPSVLPSIALQSRWRPA